VSGPRTLGGVALGAAPVVVAAGGEADVDALVRAAGAHVLELRADLFTAPSPETLVPALRRLAATGKPVLLTVRAAREGGGAALDDDRRAALYAAGLPLVQAVDVEIASTDLARALVPRARAAGVLVLLSAHDFAATPPREVLDARIDAAFAAGADVAKLATHTATAADLQVLLAVTLAARARGVATLGMGPLGPLSRVVLPAAGSLLTYAAAGAPTAPGQLPVGELAPLLARLYPTR
jgi:3-dehydroquinate dehydratase-1